MFQFTRDAFLDHPLKQKISAGDYTYGVPIIKDWGHEVSLEIGKFCSIGDGVTIFLGGDHWMNLITTYPLQVVTGKAVVNNSAPPAKGVVIGNDVWIGDGATILSGVTIGDGACIGANCVVAKDVRPYALVVGNSAREVRRRFTAKEIAKLQKIRWWDWPHDVIVKQFDFIMSNDINRLYKFAISNNLLINSNKHPFYNLVRIWGK